LALKQVGGNLQSGQQRFGNGLRTSSRPLAALDQASVRM
jgi:hypothetical protein